MQLTISEYHRSPINPDISSGKRAAQAEKTQFNGLEYELSATLGISVVLPTFSHFRPGTETAYLVILPTSGHFRPINVKAKHNRTAIYEIYRTNLDRITAVANALPMETTLYNSLGPILRAL